MAYQSQDIIRHSATNGLTPAPQARDSRGEVAKLIDATTCIGYKACQMACSEWDDIHDTADNNIGVYDNPNDLSTKLWAVIRSLEVGQNDKLEWLIRKDGCMHCSDPGCLKACPAGGAIIQYANGIVDSQPRQCIGCGYCVVGYPFDIPRLNPGDNRVYKCTLCVDRVVVGREPVCMRTYPTGAIRFGTKEPVKTLASEHVTELGTRGYDNADLYDPIGVGSTHVMYVLHHADKPNLYHDLPRNSEISETVKFQEGIWKPPVAAGFAATFVASTFHYVGVDPSHVDEEESNLHEKRDEGRR